METKFVPGRDVLEKMSKHQLFDSEIMQQLLSAGLGKIHKNSSLSTVVQKIYDFALENNLLLHETEESNENVEAHQVAPR